MTHVPHTNPDSLLKKVLAIEVAAIQLGNAQARRDREQMAFWRDALNKVKASLAAAAAPLLQDERAAPSEEAAYNMGAVGGPVVEAERLAFEAWMRGHCWALCATWTGSQYKSDAEAGGEVDPRAMQTRSLWAAWRDRAALSAASPAAPFRSEARDDA